MGSRCLRSLSSPRFVLTQSENANCSSIRIFLDNQYLNKIGNISFPKVKGNFIHR
jgi:hypothetical protein